MMYHQRARGGRGGRFDSRRGGAVVGDDDSDVRIRSNGVSKRSSSQISGGKRSDNTGRNYVWVRTDLVEAIYNNGGSLPRNWKPPSSTTTSTTSRKRGRKDSINGQSLTWGWMRAYILQQSSSTSTTGQQQQQQQHQQRSSSPYPSRIGGAGTTIASITIDDDVFAPIHLKHTTVSISYNSKDTELVCNANTWWQQHTPVPPNDLTSLTHLHEPSVVYCLRERYIRDEIYTYTGKILLALNPFRILPNVYGDHIMQQYLHSSPSDNKRPPPHVYAIAQEAYQAMIQNGTNQSILVSGESGAGKTVTTKITMGYLAMQSKRNAAATTTTSTTTNITPRSPPRPTSQTAPPKSSPSRLGRARGYASSRTSADGGSSNDSSSSQQQQQQQQQGIESQILQSNPILESFGNARTVRNDNSSRFGKFMELLFTPTGTLLSATIETYLLEKVRLITQAPGERNYHIFYELLAGLPQRERQPLKIANTNALHFRMTASSGTFDRRDGVEDRDTYKDLRTALDTIGFTREEQRDIFSVACALLHTSNIDFRQPTSGKAGEEGSELVSSTSLKYALHLFGVPMEALNNALCLCAIEARGEVFYKNMSVPQSTKATEALIKATYAALFNYIVHRVNNSISIVEQQCTGSKTDDASTSPNQLKRIGVLDIFGFESFQFNSFEQLCINYCNEALQQQFNRFVFKLEQEEYEREGIEWSFIQFPDNQDVLDLIEKRKVGILSVLDEQCRLQTCTDASFCRAVYGKFTDNPRFSATNTQKANLEFSIHHYAGMVTYNATNFLEKNKDELPKETTELLMSSSVPFLAYLGDFSTKDFSTTSTTSGQRPPSPTSSVSSYYSYSSYRQNSAAPASEMSTSSSVMDSTNKQLQRKSSSILQNSVGNQFYHQLRELRLRIDSTTPHYVRCLKPNDELVPDQFEPHIIADQLRCSGVLEAIRVSRVGFPHRFVHFDFLRRYRILEERSSSKSYIAKKDQCMDLIRKISPQISSVLKKQGDDAEKISDVHRIVSLGMQIGHTKVFLRRRVYEALEYSRNEKLGISATVIQKHTRRFLAQIHYYDTYMAIIMLQCFGRRVIATRKLSILVQQNAATKIQCAWRRFVSETTLMAARLIAHFGQAYRRGDIARKLFRILRVEKQATLIQTSWRRHAARDRHVRGQLAALTIQCFWRQKVASRLLKQLRMDARDLGVVVSERDHYKEESLRLRKEVEVLRQSRQLGGMNPANNEVDELRNEVLRLQMALAQAQKESHIGASRDLDQTAITEDSSFGGFRENDLAENDLLDSPSQQSLRIAHFPPTSSPNSFHPRDFSPISRPSPPTSLLDASYADGHGEVVDFSHEVGSDLHHNTSSIHIPSNPNDDASHYTMEPPPLTERRGVEFTVNLQQLHDSIRNNDSRALNRILNASEDLHLLINEADEAGRTALHVAVSFGDLKTTRILLERGAIVNAQDYVGDTPLHLAETAPMTKLLLETGNANPNIPNLDGICVLHLAVQRRDAGSVRMLLKCNAKVDPADNTRWFTPLHLACLPDRQGLEYQDSRMTARAIIVDLLCAGTESSKADFDYQDSEGNTPLHYAVQIESSEACNIIITLLQKGSKTTFSNNRNQQPLLLLCHNNILRKEAAYQECLDSMLYHGSDPNVQSNTGCTPLHLSIYHQDIDSAVQLVSHAVELHLLWRKPKRWVAYWDDNNVSEVLALDMVQDEHSLHRLLAAITRPSKLAPIRTWCMNCGQSLGSVPRALHCRHCSRHLCGACCRTTLPPDHFPKSFEIYEASWVCVVCEKILVARKEDGSSGNTHPLSSTDENYEGNYLL